MSVSIDPTADDPFDVALDAEGLKRRSLGGSLITGLSQGVKMVIQFGSQIVLARLLFPSDFGLLAMVAPVISFIQVFNDIGLGQAIVQRPTLAQDQVSALFWVNMALSVTLGALVMMIAPLAALAYREPRVVMLMIALGAMIPIGALGIHPNALLTRKMRFGLMARNEVIATFAGVFVTVLFALMGFSYWSLVVGQLVNTIVGLALAWVACGWRPSRPKFVSSAWADLKFGGNLTGANLATYITTSGDNIIVGLMAGRVSLGLYDRSYRLVVQPLGQVLSPISRVAVPLLSRLTEQPEEYRSTYLKIFRALMMISLPLMLSCIVVGDTMIDVFLGDRWAKAGPVFEWISVGGLAAGTYSSFFWLFISQGRAQDMRRYMAWASVINVASFVVGAFWGIIGVAVVAAISFNFITTPLVLFGVTRRGPIRAVDLFGAGVPFVVQAACIFAILMVIRSSHAVQGLPEIVVSLGVAYAILSCAALAVPGQRGLLFGLARSVRSLRRP